MEFEWDPAKAQVNRRKHGLTFEEARGLFTSGVNYLEIYDEEHSDQEDRFIAIGPIERGVIVVVYTEPREDAIRIVSARPATTSESRRYQEYWRDKDE